MGRFLGYGPNWSFWPQISLDLVIILAWESGLILFPSKYHLWVVISLYLLTHLCTSGSEDSLGAVFSSQSFTLRHQNWQSPTGRRLGLSCRQYSGHQTVTGAAGIHCGPQTRTASLSICSWSLVQWATPVLITVSVRRWLKWTNYASC